MDTQLKQRLARTERPADREPAPARARQIVVLKVLVAFAFAVLIPSPFGGWPPISLLLWGLVGDPQSGMETLGSIGGGAGLLAIYTAALFGVATLATRGVAIILRALGTAKDTP